MQLKLTKLQTRQTMQVMIWTVSERVSKAHRQKEQKQTARASKHTAIELCHWTTAHLCFCLFLFVLTPNFATFHGLRHKLDRGVSSKTMASLFALRFAAQT